MINHCLIINEPSLTPEMIKLTIKLTTNEPPINQPLVNPSHCPAYRRSLMLRFPVEESAQAAEVPEI